MTLGHEKLDVYRLSIGYVAWVYEAAYAAGFDPDTDSDFDLDKADRQPQTFQATLYSAPERSRWPTKDE